MPHPLIDCKGIDQTPVQYLSSIGTIFAEFGAQDSGNVSYGVQIGPDRFFVKTAGRPDHARSVLNYSARVALLRNAARLHQSFQHPLLPRLLQFIESPDGPLLVFPWLDGELLGIPREQRDDPQSSFQRFRSLPALTILSCLDALFDLHTQLAQAGWIAVDFYDGSLLYDFQSARLWVVDVDMYRDAPFENEMGQMFGSSRFMAPEEFELGARIDQQTTVFTMGRTALLFLPEGVYDAAQFRGSSAQFKVIAQACAPERRHRFESMAAFFQAWQQAREQTAA
jgi:serine/threonine protein kinase